MASLYPFSLGREEGTRVRKTVDAVEEKARKESTKGTVTSSLPLQRKQRC